MKKRKQNPSTLIKKSNNLMIKLANSMLKPLEIPHGYTPFLILLFDDDGLTQADLVRGIGIEQPTAVRTLDRMERDGWINRERSSNDRRRIHIYLSQKAKKIEERLNQVSKELNLAALKGFTKDEKKEFTDLISRILINLES